MGTFIIIHHSATGTATATENLVTSYLAAIPTVNKTSLPLTLIS